MSVGGLPYRNHRGELVLRKNKEFEGFPDLFGILKNKRGHMFAIEVKSETGSVSQVQKAWIEKLNLLGVLAFVARDMKTALDKVLAYDVT